MKKKTPINLDNFPPYVVATLSRQLTNSLEKSLRKMNLSVSNWRVLVCLSNFESRTLNEIVDYTFLPQSTLSRALVRMEEKGLIVRERKKDDNRLSDIRISDHGMEILDKAYQTVQKSSKDQLSILNGEEAKIWMETTKKIIASMAED